MQKFCITFDERGRHYNFFDSREVVSDFLTVFENMFISRPNLKQVSFKCTFIIVNLLPVPKTRFAEINYSRMWQTNVFDGVFFNDYFKVNLEGDILKRVIINGMTGRNRRFKRFDRLCITVHSDQHRGVGK